jgi:trans-AT polyketide synthase/acyltransferase/oxidoreductase domain-containing protein
VSIAQHLDRLAAYGAMAIRVVPVEGDPEDLLGEGGALERVFEHDGPDRLAAVLGDARVASVLLADGPLEIEAVRQGPGGRLLVRWDGEEVVDEPLSVPEAAPLVSGPLFRPDHASVVKDPVAALHDPTSPLYVVVDVGGARWFRAGLHGPGLGAMPLRAIIPAVRPRSLGSAAFREAHDVEAAYVAGAMAGGIASVELLQAMAAGGLLAFFGAGGLPLEAVERALDRCAATIPSKRYGFNLLHNPVEPEVEERTVDLYLKYGVRRIEASAFMELSPSVVRYRLSGARTLPDGSMSVPNRVMAKISREEVAERFLRPAPPDLLDAILAAGGLTAEEVAIGRLVPVADDVTAEADSGGHTDRRPLVVLLPSIQRLRDRVANEEGYARRGVTVPRVGAAGGLGTPAAVWAAFAMGADYVLTGSVNQAARESGTSPLARQMLAGASPVDVTTGPAPDMFELGAEVQVLSRGTMWAQRSRRLYELYRAWPSLEALPDADRQRLERQILRRPIADVWEETRAFWAERDPAMLARAEADPHHKMALVFRWYLGLSSRWAKSGVDDRKLDFQVWCGPAMGAFNHWVAGGPLGPVEARSVLEIARALLWGAAAIARVSHATTCGLVVPAAAYAAPASAPSAASWSGA